MKWCAYFIKKKISTDIRSKVDLSHSNKYLLGIYIEMFNMPALNCFIYLQAMLLMFIFIVNGVLYFNINILYSQVQGSWQNNEEKWRQKHSSITTDVYLFKNYCTTRCLLNIQLLQNLHYRYLNVVNFRKINRNREFS